jgi:hypothetical protein
MADALFLMLTLLKVGQAFTGARFAGLKSGAG